MPCANIRVVLRKNFCGIRTLKIQAVLMNMIETRTIDQTITFYTLSKVQKILRNATRSENTFQSFNIEVYENFFFQLSF